MNKNNFYKFIRIITFNLITPSDDGLELKVNIKKNIITSFFTFLYSFLFDCFSIKEKDIELNEKYNNKIIHIFAKICFSLFLMLYPILVAYSYGIVHGLFVFIAMKTLIIGAKMITIEEYRKIKKEDGFYKEG